MSIISHPIIIENRVQAWTSWATDSAKELEALKEELYAASRKIEDEGRYTDDISTITQIAWRIHFQASTQLKAIEWSAEDYQDLNRSRAFKALLKFKHRFNKK